MVSFLQEMRGWLTTQIQPCSWAWDERPWVDALLPRLIGLAERWVLLQWTREVCSRDLEEIQDGGLQAYGHTSSFQLEEDWCIKIRRIWSYLVSLAYQIAYVFGQHLTRHHLCSQLFESVHGGPSESALDGCEAHTSLHQRYNWVWIGLWAQGECIVSRFHRWWLGRMCRGPEEYFKLLFQHWIRGYLLVQHEPEVSCIELGKG